VTLNAAVLSRMHGELMSVPRLTCKGGMILQTEAKPMDLGISRLWLRRTRVSGFEESSTAVGTYRLHLQGRAINEPIKQQVANWEKRAKKIWPGIRRSKPGSNCEGEREIGFNYPHASASFLRGLLFDPGDAGHMFLRNVGICWNYTALQPREQLSSL
jgi:hypothetical protein